MSVQQYIAEKKAELAQWERTLEERAHLKAALAPWHAKKDEMVARLEALAKETGDRWDVLRMGVESAWAELRATYDALTSKEAGTGPEPRAQPRPRDPEEAR